MIRFLRLALLFCCIGFLALDAYAVKPMVAVGSHHSIGLSADGKVYGWGADDVGQLGLGRTVTATFPQAVPGLNLGQGAGKSRVASGVAFNLTVKSDGSVWAWGYNSDGQLGDGTTTNRSSPVQVQGLTNVVAVSTRGSLAVKSDGSVWALGDNKNSQPDDGTETNRYLPVRVQGLTDVVAVADGGCHSLALKSDGSVWAWGDNHYGGLGLGDGTTTYLYSLVPVLVPRLTDVTAVAANACSSFVVKSDGSVWAWGNNSKGQLGDGTTEDRFSPVRVPGLAGVVAVAAGYEYTLAIKSDGNIWAWGDNSKSQLGDGTTTNRFSPVPVPGLTGVVALAVAKQRTLALKSDGSVWAWGDNSRGLLGDGTTTNRSSPVQVPGLTGVVALSTGYGAYGVDYLSNSLALKSDGSVWVWGDNELGQLGDGVAMVYSSPTPVPGLAGVVAVAAGSSNTVALKSDGSVWAWGWNMHGQVGDGTTTDRSSPVRVPGLTNVVAVAMMGWFIFTLKSDGSVWEIGTSLERVTELTGAVALAANDGSYFAVKSDGSVWAWGGNEYGQLGDGTTTTRSSPVQVPGLTGVVAVAAGDHHSLVVKSDGSVWAWGRNVNGQLGDGTMTDRHSPARVPGLTGVVAVAAGYNYTLAIKSDGSVWAWGRNPYGLFFDDTTANRTSPTPIPWLTGVVAVALGEPLFEDHIIVLKSDGSVWARGNNSWGQLGDGTFSKRSAYVGVLNDTLSGFLDLDPTVPNLPVPADKIPPFLLAASKSGDLNSLSLSARVRLAPVNLNGNTLAQANRFAAGCGSGGTCQMYVAAHAPAGGKTPVCAPASAYATESWWSPDTQRNWNGLAWPLTAFLSNVVSDQDQIVQMDILSNCNLTDQTGTEFYLGYGEDADEMLKAGRYRGILTVPDK